MADGDLYTTDILAWSEQQADILRQLRRRADLPNALDLAHVVEEIEDVGLSELNAVKSLIRLLMVHAIKCWAEPDAPSVPRWLSEMIEWHTQLNDRFARSMRQRIDLEQLWQQAIKQARRALIADGRDAEADLLRLTAAGRDCPLTFDDLLQPSAEPESLIARLPA